MAKLICLFVLAQAVAPAAIFVDIHSDVSIARPAEVAGIPKRGDILQIGNFLIRNNTRCNGHYRVASWEANNYQHCENQCQLDERCSSYSLELNDGKGCFLFDSEAACLVGNGWITGRKDTRCAVAQEGYIASLKCPFGAVISEILFASYGSATGSCGSFEKGNCDQFSSKETVEDLCLGETECAVSATSHLFGEPCPVITKTLKVQVKCSVGRAFNEDVYFNAWSSRHWADAEKETGVRRTEWQSFLAALPTYPVAKFKGRGILIIAGGAYLEPAIVNIKMLRQFGCTLRIQIWHLGPEEMTPTHRALLEPYAVETRDFKDYVGDESLHPIQSNVGMRLFQLKPLALLHTDMEDVMLLDSDNCPIRDPSYLFDSPAYQNWGTIFWPDYWVTSVDNPIWKIIGKEPTPSWEQESGQLLINKQRAWAAINLCVHLNTDFYMKLLNGDKDTFRFSWMASETVYFMVKYWPVAVGTLKEIHSNATGFCSHTMLQHDLVGNPLFVHHNQLKTAHLPIGENFRYQRTPGHLKDFKAVPVAGLELGHGFVLPCIDIQGMHADEDECAVEETALQEFEAQYFQAQASIPNGTFTESERHRPSLVANSEDHNRKGSSVYASLSAANILSKIRRKDTNTTCTFAQFELAAPTLIHDRLCESLAQCSADQLQQTTNTLTSDRVCVSQHQIVNTPRQFAVRVDSVKVPSNPYFGLGDTPSCYTIRDISNGGAFLEAADIVVTRLAKYEFIMDNISSDYPFILTLDNIGGPKSVPYTNGITGNDATGTNTLTLIPDLTTPSILYYHAHTHTYMGWRLSVKDATYKLVYSGNHAGYSNAFLRFTTAYSPAARLFLFSDTAEVGKFKNIRDTCQTSCSVHVECKGIFIYRTAKSVVCFGLSDVGGVGTETTTDNQSFLKMIA